MNKGVFIEFSDTIHMIIKQAGDYNVSIAFDLQSAYYYISPNRITELQILKKAFQEKLPVKVKVNALTMEIVEVTEQKLF